MDVTISTQYFQVCRSASPSEGGAFWGLHLYCADQLRIGPSPRALLGGVQDPLEEQATPAEDPPSPKFTLGLMGILPFFPASRAHGAG